MTKTEIKKLITAQRQLERSRDTIANLLGIDYQIEEGEKGERLLDGFDLAEHHLEHAIRRNHPGPEGPGF